MKVGTILPLSGPVAEFGVAAKNGIELALKEHPAKFSAIKFVYDDSQYDGKLALSAYSKLRNSDDVSLLYVWGYGPNQALVPVAERDKFPVLAVTAERSISLNRKYTLRFCYHIEMMAQALLSYLRSQGLKKLGIIKTELAYINGLIDSIKADLRSGESVEIIDAYQAGDNDFKSTISKIKARQFEAVGVFLISGQISQFYRQAKQLGMESSTFGTDFFDSIKEIQDAQGAMNGAVFAAPYADHRFVARYVKQYGNDLQVAWAANGYEFAMLTASLFGPAPQKLSAQQILELYRASRQPDGLAATEFWFKESPEGSGFDFKVVNRRIESDKIIDLE